MTLEKALEILSQELLIKPLPHEQDFKDAVKLGIEALREVKMARFGGPTLEGELLPGETE